MKNAHLGALEVSRIGLGAMTMAGIDSSPANVKAAIEGSLKPAGTAIMEGADMGQAKTWTAFDVHVSVVAATLDRRREHPADRRPLDDNCLGGAWVSVTPPMVDSFAPGSGTTGIITGFSPSSGPSGTVVAIKGIGFTPESSVDFNGTAATVSYVNSSEMRATVPSIATTGQLR